MKTVDIKLTGLTTKFQPYVVIDGKQENFKKNNFDSYQLQYQTEKDEIQVEVYRFSELAGKLWWLYAILTFIVSIFGIFEPYYDRKSIVLDCKFTFKLKDVNVVNFKFNSLQKNGRAVEVECDCEKTEISNAFLVDKKLKRRWTLMLLCKIAVWIVLIVLTVYFISKAV